jgi:drug/metabolite transporter (DMT)-like permease
LTSTPTPRRWIGPLFAVLGVLGFSFKAILIKLAYAAYPIDAVTLLTLRMIYSAPFFVAMAWWATRSSAARRLTSNDWGTLVLLGFVGYYLASLLDFVGLQYISAGLERLVLFLYPTFVVVLSAVLFKQPITRRTALALLLSYAGIALVVVDDMRHTGDAGLVLKGGAYVFASGFLYAIYLVRAGGIIGRVGSLRFIAWAMLASTMFVVAQFLVTREIGVLRVPATIHGISFAMAVFSTVAPTWLIAESIHRLGANTASQIGSLGPVFTIGLGALLLGESVHAIQVAGAALVLAGVLLVTRKRVPAAASDQP